jgi:hypothetical protein
VKDSIYAVSTQPMSGGARQIGVVGSDDLAAANADFSQKARDEFLASGAGANLPDNVKVIVGVVDVKTNPSHNVGQEASEFSLTGTTTLLVATYHIDDVRRLLEQEIRRRSDTDSLKVLGLATDVPAVSIASYDVASKTAQLTISQEAMVTLDAASARLTPENFAGKTKSEIETYVNGFQYVAGTEVKFSPQFLMRTAPSLSDKIKVIVKNIKKEGKMYPLAWDIARLLSEKYELKDEKLWIQDKVGLAPYGYPSAWASNILHHYCLIFQKK